MKNILLIGLINWFPNLIEKIKSQVPDLLITANYEEVNAMMRDNEPVRVCVITSAYNYSKNSSNNAEGFEVAREFHKINPNIPMMIINGAETELSEKTGLLESISVNKENEIYIDTDDDLYQDKFKSCELFKDFFNGIMPAVPTL